MTTETLQQLIIIGCVTIWIEVLAFVAYLLYTIFVVEPVEDEMKEQQRKERITDQDEWDNYQFLSNGIS